MSASTTISSQASWLRERGAVSLLALASIGFFTPGAAAQESRAAPVAAEQSTEIIVTARKREEAIQDIPESISVFGQEAIESRGIRELGGIAETLPNLSFNQFQDAGTVYMSMRGVNSIRTGEPPVAMVIDGVQLAFPEQLTRELSDVQQLEVLRGPQGSLYGRNAIGGAINVTTREPGEIPEGSLSATIGNGGDRRVSASVGGPIAGNLRGRLRASRSDFDGVISNTNLNQDVDFRESRDVGVRLLYEGNSGLTVDVSGSILDEDYGAFWYKAIPDGNVNNESAFTIQADRLGRGAREMLDGSLRVSYDFSNLTLTSVTAVGSFEQFFNGDLDFTPLLGLEIGQQFDRQHWSQELRLTSDGSGAFQWLAGLYYLDAEGTVIIPLYLGPDFGGLPFASADQFFADTGVPIFRTDFQRQDQSYAVFGQADWEFVDDLTLTLGLRFDRQEKQQLNRTSAQTVNDAFESLQPKVSLAWRASDDLLTYATIARGFRSGGFNNTINPFFQSYDSEELWSYELGLKATGWDERVTFTGSVFYLDYENRQDFFFDAALASQNIYNAPQSRVYGVEADFVFRPNNELTLRAAAGWLDTEFTEFDSTLIGYPPTIPGQGNSYPYVNHFTANLDIDYHRPIGGGWEFFVGADYSHKADLYWWFSNFEKQSPVNIVNARTGIENDDWTVRLWSNNLFDEYYITSYDPTYAFNLAANNVFDAAGRTFGLTATRRF